MSEVVLRCDERRVRGELGCAEASLMFAVGEDKGADMAFGLASDFAQLAVGFGQAFSFRLFWWGGADQDCGALCGSAHG